MDPHTHCLFEHTAAQAHAAYAEAMEFLTRHEIPPTPINYAVAYDYAVGANEKLAAELDRALRGNAEADGHLLEELFQTFFVDESGRELENQVDDLYQMLYGVLRSVSAASDGVSEFNKVLQSELEELSHRPGLETLERITRNLAASTEKALENNRDLHAHLEQARQEASHLRVELDKAREEATTDPLTGLDNRGSLARKMDGLVGASAQSRESLSVLMIDIDHFKRFNDTFGHLIGDEVLKRVAATVQENVRGTDISARYGGEEFIVVLPNTNLDGALTVANTIHDAVGKLVLIRRSSKERLPKITVSVGAASLRSEEGRDALVERADQALYLAKNTGRDRVVSERELAPAGEVASA